MDVPSRRLDRETSPDLNKAANKGIDSFEMLQVNNNAINAQADLPRYYKAFEGVRV